MGNEVISESKYTMNTNWNLDKFKQLLKLRWDKKFSLKTSENTTAVNIPKDVKCYIHTRTGLKLFNPAEDAPLQKYLVTTKDNFTYDIWFNVIVETESDGGIYIKDSLMRLENIDYVQALWCIEHHPWSYVIHLMSEDLGNGTSELDY